MKLIGEFLKIVGRKNFCLGNLVLVTNTACTLKCKKCGNFIPKVHSEYYHFDNIKNEIATIVKWYYIETLQIQGGEFFLHPDAEEIIDYVLAIGKIDNVVISTTGMIVPHKMVQCLQNNRVLIRISKYPKVDTSKFVLFCEDNKIQYSLYEFVQNRGQWLDLGDETTKKRSLLKTLFSFYSCPFRKCFTIENGYLGRCSRSVQAMKVFCIDGRSSLFKLGAFSRIKLWLYFKLAIPMACCRYCFGGTAQLISPAEQEEQVYFRGSHV